MKLSGLAILCLLFSTFRSNAQAEIKSRIFVIQDSMIESFDEADMEIVLKESALLRLNEVDFTEYSFILFESYTCLIGIIGDKMSFRPSSLFIYRHNKSVIEANRKIKIISYHLERDDQSIKSFQRIYMAIMKKNNERR